jgi:vancomycin resistance protein YoaR
MTTRRRRRRKYIDNEFTRSTVLVAATVLCLLCFCGYAGVDGIVQEQTLAHGVRIDGRDLSGMTYDEAEAAVDADAQALLNGLKINLNYSGETTVLGAEDLGVTLNQKEVLDKAYYINKDKEDSAERRFDKTLEISKGLDLHTDIIIDQVRLKGAIDQYAAKYDKEAVDATAVFDKETGSFTYTEEKEGVKINADALAKNVENVIKGRKSGSIDVVAETVYPSVTQSELEGNTALISEFETKADDNEARNVNIKLISETVNGTEIKPGEIFSVNELVGERTVEKGYRDAPAISDGILVEEVGGGICQLAGTLYNAALLADMEIVERVRHTWPSDYLPIGQDSTLNWKNKDLKIKNTSEYSIYISAVFEDLRVKVKLYGQPPEDGVTIKVQNEIVQELLPGKTEVRYTRGLPDGAVQTVRRAKKGYKVNVYRIYYKGGVEIDRQLVSTDVYPPLNKIILVGNQNTPDK